MGGSKCPYNLHMRVLSHTYVGENTCICISETVFAHAFKNLRECFWHEFHTATTSWFRITFTWWPGCFLHPTSNMLKLTKPSWIDKNYACATCSSLPANRFHTKTSGRFRVYMTPLQNLVLEWNSRPGERTGVNTCHGDSRQHDILWWYHVNKCRAMRGNQSELALARKFPRCQINTPCERNLKYEGQLQICDKILDFSKVIRHCLKYLIFLLEWNY